MSSYEWCFFNKNFYDVCYTHISLLKVLSYLLDFVYITPRFCRGVFSLVSYTRINKFRVLSVLSVYYYVCPITKKTFSLLWLSPFYRVLPRRLPTNYRKELDLSSMYPSTAKPLSNSTHTRNLNLWRYIQCEKYFSIEFFHLILERSSSIGQIGHLFYFDIVKYVY